MKTTHFVAWIFTVLALCPARAVSDVVRLKNGGTIIGIVEQTDDHRVTVRTDAGTLTLPRDTILSIEETPKGQTLLRLGESFLKAGQLDKAEAEFRRMLQEPEYASRAREALEEIRRRRERVRRRKIAETAEQAQQWSAQGRFEDAIAILSALIESECPENETLLRQRGEIRLELAAKQIDHHMIHRAKDLLVLAKQDGGSEAKLHTLLGIIDLREGRLMQAREEFRLARRAARPAERAMLPEINAELKQTEAILAGKTPAPEWLPRPQAPPELVQEPREETLWAYIENAGREFEVDPLLIEALAFVESGLRIDAVSPVGAQGLLQLMPGTAKDMGVEDPFDPQQNIRGGTKYLALMLAEFEGDIQLALAAYNAGPHKVRIYQGIPPYKETRAFVPKVLNRYENLKQNGSTLAQAG